MSVLLAMCMLQRVNWNCELPPQKISKLFIIDHLHKNIWVFPKIGGKTPKMDGENNGKPYFLMDDLGVKTHIFGSTPISHVQILPFPFPSSWVLIFFPHPLVSMGISKSSPK